MLYEILYSLAEEHSVFNVFRYITFRSGLAALTAFLVVICFGQKYINFMIRKQFGQAVRDDGPQSHLKKQGIPTMGGVLILIGMTIGVLLWADLSNMYVWMVLALTLGYGAIGLLDDYLKVVRKDPKGLSSAWKFRLQGLLAATFCYLVFRHQEGTAVQGLIYTPFFKDLIFDLGVVYILFSVFVIVGNSNAVNLTDGLDGLAIGPCVVCCAAFFILCYLGGNVKFANYLNIPLVLGIGELSILCAAAFAAGIAFLWFNSYPAQIIMGDVGSLALGALIGGLAVVSKNELLLIILGGVFVIETVSVILQVFYFKLSGKRLFKMAPIHHHFELKGWPEPKVIVRFWIISYVLAVAALSTLKLR